MVVQRKPSDHDPNIISSGRSILHAHYHLVIKHGNGKSANGRRSSNFAVNLQAISGYFLLGPIAMFDHERVIPHFIPTLFVLYGFIAIAKKDRTVFPKEVINDICHIFPGVLPF